MRKIVIISLLFLFKNGFCQLADNFSDEDFLINPTWSARNPATDFIVKGGILQSNSTVLNSNFYLSTPNALAMNCLWEFWCNLKFNTSGANYTDVYLISDQQDLQQSGIKGYFLRIGSTDDDICLYKRSGSLNTAVKLIDGLNGITASANNLLKIRITRDASGQFTLQWDASGKGTAFVNGGSATDLSFTTTSWFGIYIQQSTASFIQKHYFDDFEIRQLVQDTEPPRIITVLPFDAKTIDVTFSEPVEAVTATDPSNYTISGISPVQVTRLADVTYRLVFSEAFTIKNYELFVDNIEDLSTNRIASQTVFSFAYNLTNTAQIKPGDLRISEVLFNPLAGGSDYVEIYNQSDHTLDLSLLWISNEDPLTKRNVTSNSILMPAGSYWVLTASPENVQSNYTVNHPENMLKIVLPAYKVAAGKVVLLSDGVEIDAFSYHEGMHVPLLKGVKGVALERVSMDVPANEAGNFTSASASAGYGTPTYRNSVRAGSITKARLFLKQRVFSPDHYGENNTLNINYEMPGAGYMGSLNIYNEQGSIVRRLARNHNLGTGGELNWDGKNDNGSLCAVGIYILKFDIFDLKGRTQQFKLPCVLAGEVK